MVNLIFPLNKPTFELSLGLLEWFEGILLLWAIVNQPGFSADPSSKLPYESIGIV